jgi:sugar phosphate isomerase/epimerase
MSPIGRRAFLATPVAAMAAGGKVARQPGTRVTIGLNLYSFNKPLRDGAMTIADVIDYCARHELESLDATGYYFPGYPAVPADDYIRELKRRAFINGVAINGTGVRNDFAVTDAVARKADVQLVKNWIDVAAKLGATVIRVFSGKEVPKGHTFDQALEWMVPLFQECAEYGKRNGVIVGLQNHHDFVRTAEETIKIVNAVNSEWFGVILDVGSLRQSDPYEEIERLIPYAVSWQLKENIWYGKKEVPTDLARVKALVDKTGYRGYMPIETLGEGDPRVKVAKFTAEVRQVFSAPAKRPA